MRAAALLFILICTTYLPVLAQRVLADNAPSVVRALERKWLEAQSRNDNRALDLIFDSALVYIEYGRLITKGEYLLRIRTTEPHPQQIVMEPMTVRIFGDTAIVIGSYREKSSNDRGTLLRHWRYVDTWVSKSGRWMLVAAGAAPLPN